MKKSTDSRTSPAPATQSASAPKAALKAVTAEPTAIGAAPKTNNGSRAAASAPPTRINSQSGATVINARIDVGFGNVLRIRGEGPGLNWQKGILLECAGSDHWKISLGASTKPITFKFLINDETWSCGPDFVIEPGGEVHLTPRF